MFFRLCLLILLLPVALHAAPPTLTNVSPRGFERGKAVEATLQGTNLTPQTRLHLPFPAKQEPIAEPKPNPAQVRVRVTVPTDVPIGVYPVRALTDDGISALAWLAVDAFANTAEVEDNNTPDKAQKLTLPIVVNGQCSGGDVDYFRFAAKKGQRLVIESEAARLGSGVVPQLRLTDDRLRFLMADDSQAIQGDCRLIFDPPADGEYLLEFSDSRYRGGNPPFYRIKIGSYDVPGEVFPLGWREGEAAAFTLRGGTLSGEVTLRQTPDRKNPFLALQGSLLAIGSLPPPLDIGEHPERIWQKTKDSDPRKLDIVAPITINSRLERAGDVDRFQLSVRPGERYRFAVEAQAFDSQLDAILRITDQAGKQIALVDDVDVNPRVPGQPGFRSADPMVEVVVPADASLLVAELRDQRKRGGLNFGYRLTVEPATPDFLLEFPASELNVPKGATAPLTVAVIRRGHAGPIRLNCAGLPRGFTVQGGLVPANATNGLLTISAAANAPPQPLSFRVEGTAGDMKRSARHTAYLGRDPSSPPVSRILYEGLIASTSADAFTVQAPAAVDAVLGFPVKIPVKLTRTMPAEAVPIEVTGVVPGAVPGQAPPPGSIGFQPATAAAKMNEAVITLTAPVNAPEGQHSLTAQGKSKIGNVDRVAFSPAFTVNVMRPFTVETANSEVSLTPGQTVPVKFKVARRDPFKDAIAVRLTGLPAGVALAAPVTTIAAVQAELVVNLKVDPKAAPAKATLTLAASAAISGQTYNHPPINVTLTVRK